MTCPPALFLGGAVSPELPEQIREGLHPRVEYLYLRAHFDFRLFSFDDVSPRRNPYWGLGFLGLSRRSGCAKIVATGEDVGLPLALMQQLTGGRREVAIITHGSYFGSQKFRRLIPLLRANPRLRFLCLSESLCHQLTETHGFPKSRVENVGYGVDTKFFAPSPDIEVKMHQIAAAGMAKRDYRTLIAAVQPLDTSVKIAADSAWFQAGLDIGPESLPPHVEARSYGNYAGLRGLYAESAFVVVPLLQAVHACGFAVIAEAMAMGKPVITTKIIGHSDYVIEGETGFYVPPGDVNALRERIAFLLEHPGTAQEMGRKARQWIESRFSLEQYAARVAAAAGLAALPGE